METYEIIRLGHQGDGIAEGPVFVPMTLPGERVSGTREGSRLTDVRIVEPSDQRVSPPCRHAKSCGGCQLQHAADGFVAGWKLSVVQQALAAQGLEATFRPVLTSPAQSRRRASLSVRRTKKGALAGFHAKGSDVIIPIPDCRLLDPALKQALPVAERLAVVGGSRKGELSVLATLSETGLDLAVTGGKPLDDPLRFALAAEVEAFKLARLSWEGEVIGQREPPLQRFGAAAVVPPPGAFLQATPEGERDLLAAVQEIVGTAQQVIDLFAGCGTFALPLAARAEVHAVEGDAAMLAALDLGWRRAQGLKKVSHEARDLFRRPLMPDELRKADVVVIDPPRAGAEAQVRELAASEVPTIAFVSCNPVTFARDAKVLVAAGYALDWVQVVDQFRWSTHVELVAKFSRSRR